MYPIKNAHYKFKRHANKVDGLRNAKFLIPQIDEYFYDAYIIWLENVCEELELNQKRRDDIRELEKKNIELILTLQDGLYTADIPNDYYRYLESSSKIKTSTCPSKIVKNYLIKKDDLYTTNSMYESSYDFERVNIDLSSNKFYLYTKGFTVEKVFLTYIRKPLRPGNPTDFTNGAYNFPDGSPAIQRDIEVDSTFQANKIIDIAVLIAMRDTGNVTDYETQLNKILSLSKI